MLQLKNYKKSYGNRLILDVPELQLNKGMYWIKGINGSGKSTLFKSISGMINFEGEISIDQVNIRTNPVTYRSKVNYAEAEPLFPDFLTLKDLSEFVAKAKKAPRGQLSELKSLFSVSDYYESKVGTYSSGMLKKTGLLLSFLGKPKIIILDEPFITIDQQSTQKLIRLINKLHLEEDITFLVATHMDTQQSHLPYDRTFTIVNNQLVEE